ncbi:MAG: thioredoxin family protein [Candidatus Schekmanbacteria bacterium]|nr:thioredoxin family protein [Candidatus Schekmanbacteria bacterium]
MRRMCSPVVSGLLTAAFWLFATAVDAPAIDSPATPKKPKILEAEALASVREVVPGSPFHLAVRVDIENGWHLQAHKPLEEYYIATELRLPDVAGLAFGPVTYPEPVEEALGFADKPVLVYEGTILLRFPVTPAPDLPKQALSTSFVLAYQACDDRRCVPPATATIPFEIDVAAPGSAPVLAYPEIFSDGAPATGAAAGAATGAAVPAAKAAPASELARLAASTGTIGLIAALYLAGLGLSLTPCVYPLVPITISFFGGQSQAGPRRVAALSSLYVLGMGLTYSTLGVAAALTGRMFGGFLQQPAVLIAMAAVMVALALSMFGIYELRIPVALGGSATARTGLLGALAMGLVVGIVAAPCVGPFVIGLLAYVASIGDPVRGFWMFFVLSLGLGTPLLALALFSGSLHALPRAGAWMVWVKQFFGCVLLGMALYFLMPILPPPALRAGIWILGLGAAAALAVSAYRLGGSRPLRALQLPAIALFAAVPFADLYLQTATPAKTTFATFSDELLARAAQEGKPVLIDFSAAWCVPCHELDLVTFSDREVANRLRDFVLLRADMTRTGSPEVEALRRRFDVQGVPAVLIIDRSGNEIESLRLTSFEAPKQFLERLDAVT